MKDKNGEEINLQDYEANQVVGVQIGALGHKLWVCIDGVAVLRVNAPLIQLDDMRLEKENLAEENARLKRGDFTEEEFQNLCHNFDTTDRCRFEQGCKEYQDKLFGKDN